MTLERLMPTIGLFGGAGPREGEWSGGVGTGNSAKRFSAPCDCASPSRGVSCGAGAKARSECLRGDVQLRLRPGEEKAAKRREQRQGVVGGCDEKEGERLNKRDWTSEEVAARNKADAALRSSKDIAL